MNEKWQYDKVDNEVTYFFLLINFVVAKVEDEDFLSFWLISCSWNLETDTGFVINDDGFLWKFIFILTSLLWSIDVGVDFVDVDMKSFIELSSSSIKPIESTDGSDGDGISLSVWSTTSILLIISSEVGVFGLRRSVGKGSPGWTLKEPIINRIENIRKK